MARIVLTGKQTTDLAAALEAAFPTEATFRNVIVGSGQNFDSVSSNGQPLPTRIIESITHAVAHDWLLALIDSALQRNADPAIKAIREAIEVTAPPAGVSPFDMCRLGGGAVMVDRKPLRDAVEELVDAQGRRILVIRGTPIGKSHSVQLITFIASQVGGFDLVYVDLDPRRDDATRLVITAHDLAERLVRLSKYNIAVSAPPTDSQWSKWVQLFGDDFQTAANGGRSRWFVIDGINKVMLEQSAVDLIHDLTSRIRQVLVNIRLVLIGYEQSLPTLVVPTIQKDEPKLIDVDDLSEFFLFVHQELSVPVDDDGVAKIVARVVSQVDMTTSNCLISLAPLLADEVRKIKRGSR